MIGIAVFGNDNYMEIYISKVDKKKIGGQKIYIGFCNRYDVDVDIDDDVVISMLKVA